MGVNTGDDIMMRDFTDFVEMVDSLNGMPDIEFVEDNFEMFPFPARGRKAPRGLPKG